MADNNFIMREIQNFSDSLFDSDYKKIRITDDKLEVLSLITESLPKNCSHVRPADGVYNNYELWYAYESLVSHIKNELYSDYCETAPIGPYDPSGAARPPIQKKKEISYA